VRVKSAIKTWSILAGMMFSFVMVAGCNSEEPAASNPAPGGAATGKAGDTGKTGGATATPDKGKAAP
jgi:hypothetical protein